jgi:hypothetical protein
VRDGLRVLRVILRERSNRRALRRRTHTSPMLDAVRGEAS